MTTPTITPQQVAREAHAVLHIALDMPRPNDPEARKAIGTAMRAVDDALAIYSLLAEDGLHWEAVYEELASEENPRWAAIVKAADEARDCAEVLIAVMAEHTLEGALTGAAS